MNKDINNLKIAVAGTGYVACPLLPCWRSTIR